MEHLQNTYAYAMPDKYIMGLYAQCLSARKAVTLKNIELEGLSEAELNSVYVIGRSRYDRKRMLYLFDNGVEERLLLNKHLT